MRERRRALAKPMSAGFATLLRPGTGAFEWNRERRKIREQLREKIFRRTLQKVCLSPWQICVFSLGILRQRCWCRRAFGIISRFVLPGFSTQEDYEAKEAD